MARLEDCIKLSEGYKDIPEQEIIVGLEEDILKYALSRLVYFKLNIVPENIQHDLNAMLHGRRQTNFKGVYIEADDYGLSSNLLVDINNMQFRIKFEKVEKKQND